MTKTLLMTAAAAAALAAALPAQAAIQLGDHVTLSGFGTLGAVRTNSDEGEFVRTGQYAGATKDTSLEVDSNVGIQLTANATRWLSATVQVLAMQREQHDHLNAEAEWVFVKAQPTEGLAIRAGRMPLPMFAISDSRNVGYANTWVRPPNEVYGLALLSRLEGVDASYRFPIGSTSLTVSALAGRSWAPSSGVEIDVTGVRGLNLQWEGDGVTLRLGHVRGDSQLEKVGLPGEDRYTFTGFGALVDRNDVVAQFEVVTRRSEGYGSAVDSNGWYLLGGYRFGSWLPYASVAKTAPKDKAAPFTISGKQKTAALGVRWDGFKSAAIKAQFERVDTDGTAGVSFHTPVALTMFGPMPAPVTKPVNAFSVAVDFVF